MKYSLRSLMIVVAIAPPLIGVSIYLLTIWFGLPETFNLPPYVDVDGRRMTREEFEKRQHELWKDQIEREKAP